MNVQGFKWLNYGDSGVGKTFLAVRIAESFGQRWLYIDTHASTAALHPHEYDKSEPWGVYHLKPQKARDVRALIERIITLAEGGKSPFDIIVLDDISDHQMKRGLVIAKENAQTREANLDPRALDKQGWGNLLAEMRGDIGDLAYLATLGVNIVVIATAGENEDTGEIRPLLQGQLAREIARPFDVISFMRRAPLVVDEGGEKQLVRRLYFAPLGGFVAKDRWEHEGRFPRYIDNPDPLDILERLRRPNGSNSKGNQKSSGR